MRRLVTYALALWAIGAVQSGMAAELRFFSLGSGELNGGYYDMAKAICGYVNRHFQEQSMRCSPEVTRGSLYNISALSLEEMDAAIVQSDWQHHAYEGTSVFANTGPMEELRSISSLFVEPVTILARSSLNVDSMRRLKGLRVDIGNPSSGRYATARTLLDAFGLETDDFSSLMELDTAGSVSALCEGSIDAAILTIGHPSPLVERAIRECSAEIVGIEGDEATDLISRTGFYVDAVIPTGTYPTLELPVQTLGTVATLVTTETADDDVIRTLALALQNGQDQFVTNLRLVPGPNCNQITTPGLTAPLHPAAEAVFRGKC